MPTVLDQRPFVPTKDFGRSLDFYQRMGWEVRFRDDHLALMHLGASHFFLQNYFQPEWADNTMFHLVVDDAAAWFDLATRVKSEGEFASVRVSPPKREDYGALVTHVVDPAGVLWHFAQMDP